MDRLQDLADHVSATAREKNVILNDHDAIVKVTDAMLNENDVVRVNKKALLRAERDVVRAIEIRNKVKACPAGSLPGCIKLILLVRLSLNPIITWSAILFVQSLSPARVWPELTDIVVLRLKHLCHQYRFNVRVIMGTFMSLSELWIQKLT